MKKDKSTLSPSLRRRILARDKYTCTECGKQVPRVYLYIDRILSKDSEAELGDVPEEDKYTCLCEACSRKFKRKLQAHGIITAADRRAQLDMLIAWRREEETLNEVAFDIILDYLRPQIKPAYLYKAEKTKLRNYLKTYDILDILNAIDTAVAKYARFEGDDCLQESVTDLVTKMGGILYNNTLGPIDSEVSHIRHICRKNFPDDYNDREARTILHEFIKDLKRQGITEESAVLTELADKPKRLSGQCGTFDQWCCSMREYLPEQAEFIFESKACTPVSSALNSSDFDNDEELYPGEKDPVHGADNMLIYFANIRYRTVKYLYIQTGLFTFDRWKQAEKYFSDGLKAFLESEVEFLTSHGLKKRKGSIEDVTQFFIDGGTWASKMRGPFEWKYGGNPDMPAVIKGFIIGDMLQVVINDIFGLFYEPAPTDYDATLSSLDYFLEHIPDIINTDSIESGELVF